MVYEQAHLSARISECQIEFVQPLVNMCQIIIDGQPLDQPATVTKLVVTQTLYAPLDM
jgi:hypothetical protein